MSFDSQQDVFANSTRASGLLRVLSNEKRLMIMCHLMGGELSVQQLQTVTGLAQSTVSQQLAILRGELLVRTRREAQSVYYSIKSEEARMLLASLKDIYAAPL